QPQPEALERAAAAVRRGKVVAIPTDALYTLVADPFNLRAVSQVFKAKGRELHRSLPLLIRDTMMAEELASELNNRFFLLARPLLARPAPHHRARIRQDPVEGNRQHRPARPAPVAFESGGSAHRDVERAADLDQRQYFRQPHLPHGH